MFPLIMNAEMTQRPKWSIDITLENLIGHNVRVAARAFSPVGWNGDALPRLIPVSKLILPDNAQVIGLPVYFEGRLRQFVRRVGVVYVDLECPEGGDEAVGGIYSFRGKAAVILPGPATVELSSPFVVERLPTNSDNYWKDLQFSYAQFTLPL